MSHFIEPLTEPLGMIWFAMVLGLVWLLWRRQWRSALWLGGPTLVLFLIGSTTLVEHLVAAEEARYVHSQPAATPNPGGDPADAVVALGGGDSISQFDLLGFAARDGASRNLTAVELVRTGRARVLVLGGSVQSLPDKPGVPSMAAVQDWVVSWHVINGGVTNLGICANTHDEALAFRKLKESQGWKKVMLVTSALHMRRSEALFKKQGIDVEVVPADFEAYGVMREPGISPFPRGQRFVLLSRYLHEKIGWWVYQWRGWI